MKTIKVLESFTGYPHGKKRDFTAGETVDIADSDADLYVQKGHVKLVEPEPESAREEPAAERKGRKS